MGGPGILEALRAVAPVVAVRGNIDTDPWGQTLPLTELVQAGVVPIYMVHILQDLDVNPPAAGFHIVVSGHSHKPMQTEKHGVVYINPGSAGPRRFQLPVTVARLDLAKRPWKAEFLDLAGA